MSSAFDREFLRPKIRPWSEVQRRIALERAVEQLPDAVLEKLFDGLVRLDEHRVAGTVPAPSLEERVEAHAAATRQGKFRGELDMGHRWGDREPWQTAAWLAATGHLFNLLLERARQEGDVEAQEGLHSLAALLDEVDERCDELVVFEEEGARDHFSSDLELAAAVLGKPRAR